MQQTADGEFGGEPPAHSAEPRNPDAADERVGNRHRPAIVDPRREQDRRDILRECPDQRVGLVQQCEAQILKPADEHDIADDAGKVYVVCPYRERLLVEFAHRLSSLAWTLSTWHNQSSVSPSIT